MAIIAKNNGGNFEPIEAGMHVGRCVDMYHIGTVEETYKGDVKQTNKVLLTFELPHVLHVFDKEKGEEARKISKEYTLSMSPKANLRKDLESWRGKKFTEEEAKAFDVSKLLGIPCMLNVIHRESGGNTYANIDVITPLAKGTECPEQIYDSFEFNYDNVKETFDKCPDWVKKKISQSAEFQATGLTYTEEGENKETVIPKKEAPKTEKAVSDAKPSQDQPSQDNGGDEEEPLF